MRRFSHRDAATLGAILVAIIFLLSFLLPAGAQTSPQLPGSQIGQVTLPPDVNQPPKDPPATQAAPARVYATTKTPYEYHLAWMTIALGVAAMVLVTYLFRGHIQQKTDDFVKLFAFVIVAFSAIFLIVVGYTDSQVAPAYSLLGTIIGYVFGRDAGARSDRPSQQPSPAASTVSPDT